MKELLLGIVVLIVLGIGSVLYSTVLEEEQGQTACTLEAKQCPDGSYVGRTGPNCEFAACPGE